MLTLPGGLCVYRSVFTDIWRSEYCFGGPHAIFTEAYDKARDGKHAGVAQIVFSELAMAYLESPRTFLTEKQYLGCEAEPCDAVEVAENSNENAIDNFTCEELELVSEVVPATPFSGGQAGDHFPSCLHFTECNEPDLCCFKAQVPLSKLKGLVDEWDVKDVTDFRCDSCSNCAVCRQSAREKTKSLQEAFEQEVIEKS
jgi:hypothetical protein